MRSFTKLALASTTLCLGLAACDAGDSKQPLVTQGSFSLLSYNVAGLPQGISSSNPTVNIPLISPRLNDYDVVVVQEDFAYHDLLIADVEHPYRSEPKAYPYPLDLPPAELLQAAIAGEAVMNDGLNQFSIYPFANLERVQWEMCFGVLIEGAGDCNAEKGFSVSDLTIAPGVTARLYNLHAEAGSTPQDHIATVSDWQQLADYIVEHDDGKPLIVAGDTNLHGDNEVDRDILDEFLAATGITDVCRALDCDNRDRIDRVMFRNSDGLTFTPTSWLSDDQWLTPDGGQLSDHEPIHVTLDWTTN